MHNEVAPNLKRLSLNYHSETSLSCSNSLFSLTTWKDLLKKCTPLENYTLLSNKETMCNCECILAPLKCIHFHMTALRQTEGTNPRHCFWGSGCTLAKSQGYCGARPIPFWQPMASFCPSLPLCAAMLTFPATTESTSVESGPPYPSHGHQQLFLLLHP